jgi:hypothetical protein
MLKRNDMFICYIKIDTTTLTSEANYSNAAPSSLVSVVLPSNINLSNIFICKNICERTSSVNRCPPFYYLPLVWVILQRRRDDGYSLSCCSKIWFWSNYLNCCFIWLMVKSMLDIGARRRVYSYNGRSLVGDTCF